MHKQGLPSLMDVCVMCSELLANLVDLSKTRIFVSTFEMYKVVNPFIFC